MDIYRVWDFLMFLFSLSSGIYNKKIFRYLKGRVEKHMVKTTKALILSLVLAFGLAGCSSQSTSQTSVSLSVKTDDGEKNYSMKAENNNGGVKVEETVVTKTAAEKAGDEMPEYVVSQAEWVDELLSEKWDTENEKHYVSYDESTIYIQVWGIGVTTIEDIDEEVFRKEIIPSWQESTTGWQEAWQEEYSDIAHVYFQYASDNEEDAFFTLEDGEVTYFVFDE